MSSDNPTAMTKYTVFVTEPGIHSLVDQHDWKLVGEAVPGHAAKVFGRNSVSLAHRQRLIAKLNYLNTQTTLREGQRVAVIIVGETRTEGERRYIFMREAICAGLTLWDDERYDDEAVATIYFDADDDAIRRGLLTSDLGLVGADTEAQKGLADV